MTRVRGSCVPWVKGPRHSRPTTLLSPDARFANRFRDKHARRRRTPLYDRRGKFAGENGRRYFIPVYRCSAPPLFFLSLSLCPSSVGSGTPAFCTGQPAAPQVWDTGVLCVNWNVYRASGIWKWGVFLFSFEYYWKFREEARSLFLSQQLIIFK